MVLLVGHLRENGSFRDLVPVLFWIACVATTAFLFCTPLLSFFSGQSDGVSFSDQHLELSFLMHVLFDGVSAFYCGCLTLVSVSYPLYTIVILRRDVEQKFG